MFFIKRNKKINLLRHQLFRKIEFALNFQIDRINIKNKIKSNIIKMFLKMYFSKFRKILTDYVYDENRNSEKLLSLFSSTIEDINDEALSLAVPEIFLDKYKEMQKNHIESIYSGLENIMNSSFYTSEENKIIAMFDVLISHFVFITTDSERSMNELNGTLESALKGTIFDE